MQLVILGKGDQKYEEFFHWASQQYHGRMAVCLDYNEALSMAIYSGADLFLMPSKSEPCGLSQMIAMRYGTVPIVRETGGLKDTVHAYEAWRDSGNGFSFGNYASADMLYVIREAVELYKENPEAFDRLRKRAMSGDFSWAKSAKEYLRIYANITGQVLPVAESEGARPFEDVPPVTEEAETPVKKVRKAAAKKATATAKKDTTTAKKTVKKAAKKMAETAEEVAEKVAETAGEVAEKVAGAAEDVAEKAEELTEKLAKTTAKRTRKKAAEPTEGEEKPAKRTRKTAAKKTEEAVEEAAEKPAKKTARKTAEKKETKKKGPAKTEETVEAE